MSKRPFDQRRLRHSRRRPGFGYRSIADRRVTQPRHHSHREPCAGLCSQELIWPGLAKKRGLNRRSGPPVHDCWQCGLLLTDGETKSHTLSAVVSCQCGGVFSAPESLLAGLGANICARMFACSGARIFVLDAVNSASGTLGVMLCSHESIKQAILPSVSRIRSETGFLTKISRKFLRHITGPPPIHNYQGKLKQQPPRE